MIPFGSLRNMDMIREGLRHQSCLIIRIRVKSMIPLLKAIKAWKRMLRVKRRVMILKSPYFLDNAPEIGADHCCGRVEHHDGSASLRATGFSI
jgi:hypothetical protein